MQAWCEHSLKLKYIFGECGSLGNEECPSGVESAWGSSDRWGHCDEDRGKAEVGRWECQMLGTWLEDSLTLKCQGHRKGSSNSYNM